MKNVILITFILCLSSKVFADESQPTLNLTCQDYAWSDVEELVAPYLDDSLYAALVMQGLSSNYKTSEAAGQAMDKSLPKSLQTLLQALIDADC